MKKPTLYFDTITGDIVSVKKSQIKRLPKNIKKIEFTKNQEGKDVMRFNFDGATVDVLDNE